MPRAYRTGRVILSWWLVALLLPIAAPAGAGEIKGDWLGRMAEAMRNLAYEGTLVYGYGSEMETLSVVHGVLDGREHERIRALTGEPFEVIRDGDTIRALWPSREHTLIAQQPARLLPSGLPEGLASLPGLYEAEVEDTSRIAGRIARVIRVTSTDEFRYGYRLWIDRESHMLLRSDLIAPDGEIVERLMFTRFSILESVGPEDFEPTHAEREYIEYGEPIPDLHALDDPEWQVTELPPGFHTVTHRSQSLPQGGNAVQQSVYSDGLASVSVFVQSLDEAPGDLFEGAAALGAVNAFVTRTDDREITVVGEVPPITVRRIARAVEQAEEQATAE